MAVLRVRPCSVKLQPDVRSLCACSSKRCRRHIRYLVQRALKTEFARAFHHEPQPAGFHELCGCKSVTRQRFAEILAIACAEPRRADHARHICHRLDAEGVPFATVAQVRRAVQKFVVERLNATDTMLTDEIDGLQKLVAVAAIEPKLWDTIEAVRTSAACVALGIEHERGGTVPSGHDRSSAL